MSRRQSLQELCADQFLVAYDYGTGGLWAIVAAPSEDAIRERYPELVVADQRPKWMTDERFGELLADPIGLYDEPRGLLLALLADRGNS